MAAMSGVLASELPAAPRRSGSRTMTWPPASTRYSRNDEGVGAAAILALIWSTPKDT